MIKNLWARWDAFWFTPQNLLGLGFMRIILCGTMFYLYAYRMLALKYYSDENWVTRDQAWQAIPDYYRPAFSWTFWSDAWVFPLHLAFVVFLFLLTLGIGGRVLMIITWVLAMGFLQRNFTVNFGADIILTLFMFYMMFTQSCARLSVLNLIRKKTVTKMSDQLSAMMIRMMQVQICVIYAYTGWEKLKGASWWDGTALWSVLGNPQMTTLDFSFMRHVPIVIPILAFLTIIFEIYFPVMVAFKKTRYAWLLMGVFFHAGIGIFMGLGPFATAMLSTYFLFIDPLILEQRVVQRFSASQN